MNRKEITALLILLALSCTSLAQKVSSNYHRVKITSSSITINGSTNINQFQCRMDKPAINDSIVVKNIWSNQKLEFDGLDLTYRVDAFECGISAMNSDFQELLNADQEPHLYLRLNSISLHPSNNAFEELDVDAEVEIYLAGVKRKIEIKAGKIYNHSSANLTLKGDKEMLMTDFSIEPPTKMFGMVKVTDDIEIEFEISMEVSAIRTKKGYLNMK